MSSANEKHKPLNVSRRTFLKASGITGITILAASVTKPSTRLFTFPQEQQQVESEGVITEKWYSTSCLNCPARCATRTRIVNGKLVRITGNPVSKVSEGEICPRGHIGLQVLYDNARISHPLKRTNPERGRNVDPQWAEISWAEAMNELSGRLRDVRNAGRPERLVLFAGLNARSDEDLIARFSTAYGTPNLIDGDSLENEAIRVGRWLADGNYSHIAYDLGNTNYILSFGGSILESERPLARNLRMWGKMRREKTIRAKVVVIDPRYSVTAARSDQWIPINPGTDGALALAIANVIIEEGLYNKDFVEQYTSGFTGFRRAILQYTPESVSAITGISAETIHNIGREFANTRPAIAWIGRGVAGWPSGTLTSYAIYCLNALVGSIDIPGGIIYQESPDYRSMPEVEQDSIAAEGLKKQSLGKVTSPLNLDQQVSINRVTDPGLPYTPDIAIGFNSNFNMTAPGAYRWDEFLGKVPYYIHIAPYISEMALYADLVLPATSYLEQWGYDHSPAGSGFAEIKIKQPVVEVNSEAKSIGDIVFELSANLGGSVSQSFGSIGNNAEEFVRFRTQDLISWDEFQQNGVWVGPDYQYKKYGQIFKTNSGKFELVSGALENVDNFSSSIIIPGAPRYEAPGFLGDEKEYPLILNTYQPLLQMESGSQNYPWAQEIYMAMYTVGWTSVAEINAETAHSFHVSDGDDVWLETQYGKIKAKARVTEWVKPGVVSVARGQGHFAPGEFQKNIGINPNEITGIGYDKFSGQSALYNTRVKVYRA